MSFLRVCNIADSRLSVANSGQLRSVVSLDMPVITADRVCLLLVDMSVITVGQSLVISTDMSVISVKQS